MQKTRIKVERVGPYGVMSDGKWFGLREPLNPQMFVKDVEYDVEFIMTGTNKVFVTKAVPVVDVQKTTTKVIEQAVKAVKPTKYGKELSDYEVAQDKRISRAGLFQAVVQSNALTMFAKDYQDWLRLVEEVSEAGLKFVNK